MNIARRAFTELFPNFVENRKIDVSYSAKFKSLNANVRYSSDFIKFSLSKEWLEYSVDLQIGVIQHLLVKMYPKRKRNDTLELDLYLKFINNLNRYSPVEHSNPELEDSFKRINKEYFNDLMNQPNLLWGTDSFRKLGHYEYQTDTVVISTVFRNETMLLDYIMYHELLHKKHGHTTTKSGRSIHHSTAFKKEEKKFKVLDVEKLLTKFLRKKRFKRAFGF